MVLKLYMLKDYIMILKNIERKSKIGALVWWPHHFYAIPLDTDDFIIVFLNIFFLNGIKHHILSKLNAHFEKIANFYQTEAWKIWSRTKSLKTWAYKFKEKS